MTGSFRNPAPHKMPPFSTALLLLFVAHSFALLAQSPAKKTGQPLDRPQPLSQPRPSAEDVQEWGDRKFGMFIHFGLYSELGGMWQGKIVDNGYSEQIMANAPIPMNQYAALADKFNPTRFDPDAIVALAKAAGMKFIVITSKHHDGFNMFHTAQTKYNIVDATPYKRDVVKQLSEACARGGMKFGVYYSTIDWHQPGASTYIEGNSNPIAPGHAAFNVAQLKELLSNYGPISEIWFDMGKPTPEQSRMFTQTVHRLQPSTMVSGRVFNYEGDFTVMGDNEVPAFQIDEPWQTPASIFGETWGYRSWQKREDIPGKIHENILRLVQVVSRGGNYILNIGPEGDGSVVPYEADVLRGVGDWLKGRGEAIYSTTAEPFRKLGVRANADIPRDAIQARAFGAEGIGLCRTEHMFFGEDRIKHMRAMILAGNEKDRRAALKKLLPMQRSDFIGVFRAMDGFPVTIRTLDPPLHEFLPRREDLMVEIAVLEATKPRSPKLKGLKALLRRVEELHEFNPMLGHRGCRLGITYPEITEMQARAIFEAAVTVAKEGVKVFPEVMIPLTATLKEMANQGAIVRRVAEEVFKEKETTVDYLVGTMIELPRAALVADEIAKEAEFFSFGTNDLTQTTFGFSRDDINKVLPTYLEEGILKQDPFAALDREGVGQLIRIATERGRKTRPGLKVGICGEHGGEPSSVEFCHQVGLNYVSCSPFRVLTARLAAAQAAASDKLKVEAGRTK